MNGSQTIGYTDVNLLDQDLPNDAFVKLLQSQAMELELHESDHASVHLKLIPKDETDRARKQLGN